jgi:hypothetical protein
MDYCSATTGLRNTLSTSYHYYNGLTCMTFLRTVTKNCNYGGGGEELRRRVLEIGTKTLFVFVCRYCFWACTSVCSPLGNTVGKGGGLMKTNRQFRNWFDNFMDFKMERFFSLSSLSYILPCFCSKSILRVDPKESVERGGMFWLVNSFMSQVVC